MLEETGRRSIFSSREQAKLVGVREENVRKMKEAIGKQIDRLNRGGCGLLMDVVPVPEVPGKAKALFYLASNPRRRIIGVIDGNILNLRGQDCGTPAEFRSVLQWIARSLVLGFGDEFDELPAQKSGPAVQSDAGRRSTIPGTGLVPVTQPTDVRGSGFVREIKLD